MALHSVYSWYGRGSLCSLRDAPETVLYVAAELHKTPDDRYRHVGVAFVAFRLVQVGSTRRGGAT